MCGIAGFLNAGTEADLQRMAARIRHRGPDDSGFYYESRSDVSIGLASTRLAILDLSPAGHMPMTSPDQRFHIVYNGEVYNYPELRRELESLGYVFRSHSDTEAVLYLFQEFGAESVKRLNGIFSFAIWDKQKRELFLARDKFGVKPLYYFHERGRLVFASEIKAILEAPSISRELDLNALNQYLTLLWVPDPLTMFKGIRKVPAGHYAVAGASGFKLLEYWDLPVPDIGHKFDNDQQSLTAQTRTRWQQTVQSQLLSDVPLGCFLSSGLDSSSILAAMHSAGVAVPNTYTISFPQKALRGEVNLDDTAVAARTAARFGCVHHNILVEPNVTELLPKIVWHMDEPIADPAAIMAYLVNREARRSATVLLSGVGGDELFAGYRKYQAHYLARHYQMIPSPLRRGLIEPVIAALPVFRKTALKGRIRLAKKMVRSGSLPPLERFLTDSVYLTHQQKQELLNPDCAAASLTSDPFSEHRRHFARVAHADFLNQMLYVDLKTFTVSLNLTYNDKMSMASSVEVRVPFLDPDFAAWTFQNVPPALKLNHNVPKFLLREAMKSELPDEVFKQKKAGFGAPIDNWLCNDLNEMMSDLLGEQQVKARGIFKPSAVQDLISKHRSGREDYSLQIWQLLTLEIWIQTFLGKS